MIRFLLLHRIDETDEHQGLMLAAGFPQDSQGNLHLAFVYIFSRSFHSFQGKGRLPLYSLR